ncbi:DOMON domain-containing protein [Tautonia plasticadhaerens]|uniref:Carbohydrate-binding domain-containing protein n=1 Tax=Tautonia plasticadhaerens TaxID=2527974 RepID=A0A518GWX5_9BACT|nr:hypothetical protein [Tautonia plasticadhaerens]QDV33096.1 hypothetical protein ElP_09380 [Tautonia plasticadhaerens]
MSSPAPSPPLIPPSFYFRPSMRCPRVDGIPRGGKGRLLGLPESCALPCFGLIDGRAPWAEVRAAWNPEGLAVSVEVTGKPGTLLHAPDRPEDSDGVQLWVDTRDTRDIHRASRHCHRFIASVVPGKGKALDAAVRQAKIARATADAPTADPGPIRSTAERTRTGYRLELFLPASVLHGFDPETNRRLGFCYRVTDPDRGDQHLTVGREFPVGEDPSLWATLELSDDG